MLQKIRHSEVDCRMFTLVTYVFVFGSMCVFGFVGNSLSFVVMQHDRRVHAATFLLQVMAMTDNAFLLATGFSQIVAALLIYRDCTEHPVLPFMYKYVHPLVHITQLATVWITVLVAFNRYIAICRPFQAQHLCTMSKVRAQVSVMFLLIVLYNIPRFCEYDINYEWDSATNTTQTKSEESQMKKNPTYNMVYENILYCILVFLGPLIVLVVFNVSLVRELLRVHRRQVARHLPPSKAKGEEQEQNITLVMVVIIIVFLVCQTPAYINQLLSYALGGEAYDCGKPYYYYFHVSNLVVSSNSVFNFVIYCVFRKQFRQRLKNVCGGGGGGGSEDHRRCSTSFYPTVEHLHQSNSLESNSRPRPFHSLKSAEL